MIGVFVSFTLSQAGMVIHWRKTREPGWKTSAMINGFGALVTGIVLIIVAVTKTLEGAWIVLLLIPLIVDVFKATHRHYEHVASELTLKGYEPAGATPQHRADPDRRPAARGGRGAALRRDAVGRCAGDLRRRESGAAPNSCGRDWAAWGGRVKLVVLPSPFRSLMEPLLEYIEQAADEKPQRLRHGDPAGVRAGALVAAPATQPDVAAHQGRAAVPAEHRRHERAVPSVEIENR